MESPRDEQADAPPGANEGGGQADAAAGGEGIARSAEATLPTRADASSGPDTVSGHGSSGDGESEQPRLAPHTVVGRYIVLGHLGSGGMGVVYKAYDPDLDRQIALKLVRVAEAQGEESGNLRGRLLREAQGLAKLSHPNVVAIYDVGLFEHGVFLAMELVSGPTLREWLKSGPSYRDKLRVFIAAGEGLAAAHRAELVHRDFKPDNVILGADGRPRVLDFGLVRAARAGEPAAIGASGVSHDDQGSDAERGRAADSSVGEESYDSLDSMRASLGASGRGLSSSAMSGELDSPLTRVGSVLGTPRYMSPEQFLGLAVDANSDQFSFCVALYEAVYGKPPFRGKKLPVLRDNICEGRVRPPPAGVRVPAPVRRAILKGVAGAPDRRHASMEALLVELRRDPNAKRRRIGVAVGAVALAGLAAWALAQRGAVAERCRVDERATRALWNASAERAIGAAFEATGRAHAADAANRVGAALDRRAATWSAMHKASCEATWVRGTQSEALLDLRSRCLDERRAEQLGLIALLSQPELDAATVDRAVEAASRLPPIASCADARVLRSTLVPPPPGVEERAAELRERLAQVRVSTLAGDYRVGAADGEALVDAVRALEYPALLGEAAYEYGMAMHGAGQLSSSQAALEQALEAAAEGGDDHTAALAAAKWLAVVGYASDRPDEALLALPMARALAARVADDVDVQLELHNSVGNCYLRTGDYAAAQTEYRQALELVTRAFGSMDLRAAKLHNNIGLAANNQRDYATGAAELTVARDLWRSSLGAEHPNIGIALNNLGLSQAGMGRRQEALATFREALRIWEAAQGPDSLAAAEVLVSMAKSFAVLGQLQAGADAAERSLRILDRELEPNHLRVGFSAFTLAEIYRMQGKRELAVELYRRAVPAFEPSHPFLGRVLLYLGRGLSEVGRDRDALEPIERAVAFATERALPGLPDAEAALAQALWRTGDRPRARRLAERALAAFEAAGRKSDQAALADWLGSR